MSWSRRSSLAALLGAVAILTACSFQPLYGPDGAGTALNRKVAIADPRTTRDYIMARELERAFGAAPDPAFRLDYTLTVGSEDAAITSGQDIDRVNLIGALTYSLRALPGDTVVISGGADGLTSYPSADDPIAVNAAREDAELRLARILAGRTARFVLSDPTVAAAAGASP